MSGGGLSTFPAVELAGTVAAVISAVAASVGPAACCAFVAAIAAADPWAHVLKTCTFCGRSCGSLAL